MTKRRPSATKSHRAVWSVPSAPPSSRPPLTPGPGGSASHQGLQQAPADDPAEVRCPSGFPSERYFSRRTLGREGGEAPPANTRLQRVAPFAMVFPIRLVPVPCLQVEQTARTQRHPPSVPLAFSSNLPSPSVLAFPGHRDRGPMLVNTSFPHLRLTDWPFSVVPQPDSCDYIANRDHLRSDIQELVDALSRRNVSNIHILWAWFGAGKTHSMYFIRNLALQEHDSFGRLRGLVPVYSEFPREPTGFLDVYRTFSSAIDLNLLRDSFFELSTGKHADTFGARLRSVSIDLHNALHTLATGEDSNRAIAERWLRGQRLPVAEFRKAGISGHISSVEQAITTFAKIIEVLAQARQALGARVGRVVWLLDEFQRIAGAAPKVLRGNQQWPSFRLQRLPCGPNPDTQLFRDAREGTTVLVQP